MIGEIEGVVEGQFLKVGKLFMMLMSTGALCVALMAKMVQ